jgi:hypothetical protein
VNSRVLDKGEGQREIAAQSNILIVFPPNMSFIPKLFSRQNGVIFDKIFKNENANINILLYNKSGLGNATRWKLFHFVDFEHPLFSENIFY